MKYFFSLKHSTGTRDIAYILLTILTIMMMIIIIIVMIIIMVSIMVIKNLSDLKGVIKP